jgi:hypothetical protein
MRLQLHIFIEYHMFIQPTFAGAEDAEEQVEVGNIA